MQVAFSQTSVYFCKQTGAIGYCVGDSYVNTCAYDKCIYFGGYNPQNLISTYSKGYGAIAIGYNNGNRVVGASAGWETLEQAKQAARNSCYNAGGYNVYIHDSWGDF